MMAAITSTLPFDIAGLRGKLTSDEPMAKHTSWRLGGPADYFYIPADRKDVVDLIQRLPADMPIYWIGLGSNLLVRDGGVEGLVIKTSQALSKIALRESNCLYVEAGVSCAKVARNSVRHELDGAQFLAGVPGTFGGALAMNAGAFGGETWPLVDWIDCVDRNGQEVRINAADVEFGYRHVQIPSALSILAGKLRLQPLASLENGQGEIRSLLEKRSASQPIQSANAGSVFKNPVGQFAAKIIQQLQLKGMVIGGARFSEKHANFIINDGDASAAEVEALIDLAISKADQELNIKLEPEVRIIGRRGKAV